MSDTDHEPTSRDTRSNSKVFVHVPPRIDQEYYQVELPYVYHDPRPVEGLFILSIPSRHFSFILSNSGKLDPWHS
jgi:hypothetical protein